MISTKTLLLALATTAALSACSSEPSDWRPDDKVSVDMVPPGTRDTENFHHEDDVHQSHGASIAEPINSGVNLDEHPAPSAEGSMSADAEPGMRRKGMMNDAGKASREDTTSGGHEVQR